jgi:hypothetical protein
LPQNRVPSRQRKSSFGHGAELLGFSGYANNTGNGARASVNYGSQIKCFAGYANLTSNGAPRIK